MPSDGKELHVHEQTGEWCDTAVDGWVKQCKNWSGHEPLNCFAVLTESYPPSARCAEKARHVGRLEVLQDWMLGQGDALYDTCVHFVVVALHFDEVWYLDGHQSWVWDTDLKMRLWQDWCQGKTFVGWHNLEVSAIKPRGSPGAYVQVLDWWESCKPTLVLFGPSPSQLAYLSNFVLVGSEADKALAWQILICKLLVFLTVSSIAVASQGVFMSNTITPCIVDDGLMVLVPMIERLGRWVNDHSFFDYREDELRLVLVLCCLLVKRLTRHVFILRNRFSCVFGRSVRLSCWKTAVGMSVNLRLMIFLCTINGGFPQFRFVNFGCLPMQHQALYWSDSGCD